MLAGAVAGLGLLFAVLGWGSLLIEAGNRCGGRFGPPCPEGPKTLVWLTAPFGFGGYLLMLFWVVDVSGPVLPRSRRLLLALAGAAVAAPAGWGFARWLHGPFHWW